MSTASGRGCTFQYVRPMIGNGAIQLYAEKKLTISEICKVVGVSRSTLYRYVRKAG